MDWYYPILGGVLRGHAGRSARRARSGTRSSSTGRGVRCVSDQPWVTAAETCELVMALDAIGAARPRPRAVRVGAVPPRTTTARYWTGMNFDDERFDERGRATTPPSSRRGTPPRSCSPPTRSAARARPPGLFRGEGLPAGLTAEELIAAGAEIDAERRRPNRD